MESVNDRDQLEKHLGKLRVKRGQKLLDGQSTKAVAHAIKETVEGLEGVEDVPREAERREQSEAKKRRVIERSNVQAELKVVREEIVTATSQAQEAAKELVKQLRLIFELYGSARIKTVALGDKIDIPTTEFEVTSRFGFRVARALSLISARSANRCGPIQWSLHGVHPVNEDWVARETKILGIKGDDQ